VTVGRAFAAVVVIGGIAFGFFGGEYSTKDLWTLGRDIRDEQAAITRLDRDIDSLRAWTDSLEHDSATQEKVAREKFGMIRNGEILYHVEEVPR
jgi:cell division protein FtsB